MPVRRFSEPRNYRQKENKLRLIRPQALLLFLLVFASSCGFITPSRICEAEGRKLTDEELIERIMSQEIKSVIAGSVPEPIANRDSGYKSYEDLISKYPDCCSFHDISRKVGEMHESTRRAARRKGAVGYVTYRYGIPYTENGKSKNHITIRPRTFTSACGTSVSF